MSFKRIVLANYFGSGWTVIIGVAFVPLYIRYMGIEAYGLVGIGVMMFSWFSLLDLGIMQAVSRELARSRREPAAATREPAAATADGTLVRSSEGIVLIGGLVIVLTTWISASWLADTLVRESSLARADVRLAVLLIGLLSAIRLAESLYRSCLVGLSRQIELNVLSVTIVTVRAGGAVVVLAFIEASIVAFYVWQVLVTLVGVVLSASLTYRTLGVRRAGMRFSWERLSTIRRFAIGILGVNLLKLVLTQSDKLLLVRFLSLADYGAYTLAASMAAVATAVLAPITQASTPRLNAAHASGDRVALVQTFHQSAQLASVLLGAVAVPVILWPDVILTLWTRDEGLSSRVAPVLSVLMLGSLLNGLWWIPYQAQLVHGWTSFTLKMTIASIGVILPALLISIPRFGGLGAAWAWVGLNAGHLIVGSWLVFRRVFEGERCRWFWIDTMRPLVVMSVAMLALKADMIFAVTPHVSPALFGITWVIALAAGVASAPLLRPHAARWLQKLLP